MKKVELYGFTPNDLGIMLSENKLLTSTINSSVTEALLDYFGYAAFDRHCIAQDFDFEQNIVNDIFTCVNPDEKDHKNFTFTPIGRIRKLV